MIRKLLRIGNSVGVTLDKKMLRAIDLDGSTFVAIEMSKNKKGILIRKRGENEW
jgi:antitoxin component of MazEF toxin-antitoxin module